MRAAGRGQGPRGLPSRRAGGLAALGLLLGCLGPGAPRALAEPQLSVRWALGGGGPLGDSGQGGAFFETGLRAELLFGEPGDGAVRLGPALEVRSADLSTLETLGGAGLLLPLWRGYPLVLTLLGGAELLGREEAVPRLAATLAWGYRSYDHGGVYAFAAQLYLSGRADAVPPGGSARRWELGAGVEIDLELLLLGPAMVAGWLQGPAPESR